MLFHRSHLSVLAVSILVLGCADAPTAPAPLTRNEAPSAAARKNGAALTAVLDQTISGNTLVGTIRVTKLTQAVDGSLLASGIISGTANGTQFTQAFTDVPATLRGGSADATSAATTSQVSTQAVASCQILFLDLGPLFLNVLGLQVNLSEVVLDITAVAGAGNLLGNLLCAVVSLLDGPALFAAISNLLDQINAILGALSI